MKMKKVKEKRHTIFDIKKPVSKKDFEIEDKYNYAQKEQNAYTKILVPIASACIAISTVFGIIDLTNDDISGMIANFVAAGFNILLLISHIKRIIKFKNMKNDAVELYKDKKSLEEHLRKEGFTEDQILEILFDEPNYIEAEAREIE